MRIKRRFLISALCVALVAFALANHAPVTANHIDGNMPEEANYAAISYNNDYRICDASVITSPSDLQTVINTWNANAGKTVVRADCNGSSSIITDVPHDATECGGPPAPGRIRFACAVYPYAQAPQQLNVFMQDDADGYLNTSWAGQYFANTTLSGAPALTRTDNAINFDWGSGSPATGVIPVDNFSVRWTASPYFVWGGNYVFTTTTDDGVKVWVDNTLVVNGWSGGLNVRTGTIYLSGATTHNIKMEYYEGPGNAVAKLDFRADKLQTSVLAQEIGHNLGFGHLDCQSVSGETVMAQPICADLPAGSFQRDADNWNRGYWADAVNYYTLVENANGCLRFGWDPSFIHNEWRFDTWFNDGAWTYVRSDAQNAAGTPEFCGQMPGTRTYYVFSVTNAHPSYFGGNQSISVAVSGTLPQISSLVAYGTQTMQVNWQYGNPAGSEIHIERSANAVGPYTEIATDTASPYTDTGLQAGTRYYYRIRAHSHTGGGWSSYGAVTSARTTPDIPPGTIGASFGAGGGYGVSLCWSSSFGADYYVIAEVQAGGGLTTETAYPNSSCYGSNLKAITLFFSAAYHFSVKSCNESGCSGYKDPSNPYQYWTWLPCSDPGGTACSGGAAPNTSAHGH